MTYRRFDLATCGDAAAKVENAVAGAFSNVEVAKVSHHGSKNSSESSYVNTIRAQVSVISVGKNSYGHPDPGVLARWDAQGDVFQAQSSSGGTVHGNVVVAYTGGGTFLISTTSGLQKTFRVD